jgi:hypothetical protein
MSYPYYKDEVIDTYAVKYPTRKRVPILSVLLSLAIYLTLVWIVLESLDYIADHL